MHCDCELEMLTDSPGCIWSWNSISKDYHRLVQTHVLESFSVSHCVIYKSKLSWMCFHSFAMRHVFVIWYKNHCKNEPKTSTCRERQSCSHAEVFVARRNWGETHPAQLEFVYNTMNKIHDSITCFWTRHKGNLSIQLPFSVKVTQSKGQASACINPIDQLLAWT